MSASLIGPFVVLQIAAVIAIVLFLRMLLHKQLEIGLKRVKKIDQENLNKEVELTRKLEQLDREYEEKIDSAEKQADIIISEAKEDMKNMREIEREKSKEETKKIIASALLEKERMLGESQDEVRKQAVDFSVELVKRVFSEKELSGFRDKITREILSVLVSNDSVKEAIKKNGTIEIITAEKFAKKDRSYIAEEVAKNCGSGIGIKFSVQKDIMAGLILKTGESIINGGVMHRIVEMAKKMKEEL